MASKNRVDLLNKTISTTKEFTYKKGDISLGFSLNVDSTHSLRVFLSLLKEAQKDIEEELSGMEN